MIFSNQLGKLDGSNIEKSLQSIANHLRKMQEELEYRLSVLDSSNITEINADDTKIFAQGEDINNIIADQEGRMSQFQQTVEGFNNTVAEYGKSVSQYEQTVDGFRTTVDNYGNKLSEYTQTVDGFNQTVTDYEKGVSQFRQTVDGFTTQVTNYEKQYSSWEQTVNGFNQQVGEYENKVSEWSQTVDGFRQQVADYTTGYSTMEQTVNGFRSDVQNYAGNVSSYQQTVNGFRSDVQNYAGNVSSYQQTVNGFNQTVSNYEGAVSNYQQTVNGFRSDVQDYAGQVSSYQQTVNGFQWDVWDLQDDVSTTLKLDANGLYITDHNGNVVRISGDQIDAETIRVSNLYGTNIYLKYPVYGMSGGLLGYASAGVIQVNDASSASYAFDLTSYGALRLGAQSGDVYIGADGYVTLSGDDGVTSQNHLFPSATDAYTLGKWNYKWADIYGVNSEITTSDREKKNSIDYDVAAYGELFDLLKPCSYKHNCGTSGRKHIGLISQDVEEALGAAGLTSKDFAGFIKTQKQDEEGNVIEGEYDYALRYGEFIGLCISEIQKLKTRVAELERKGTNNGQTG